METLNSCRINVMVANMEAAINFYTNKLGLELLNHYGEHYAEVQAANLILGLHPSSPKTTLGNNLSIGFGVADFDGTVEDLKSKGINIKVEEEGWGRLATFADLDQNQLYLAENKG